MKVSAEALEIMETVSQAALATRQGEQTYASAAAVLYQKNAIEAEGPGCFHLFLSALARHTRNLLAHPQASLLLVKPSSETSMSESPRVTVQGLILPLEPSRQPDLRARYLARFPRASLYLDLPDFRFFEMKILEVHWIGGFGSVKTFR